ncbi:MAG TPA: YihY/virulence factor BrkB family protein [Anaeromyxobacteraceae bacterium]|nr:YihY/virulence factor BrkB family protein [Anaeromyxobacteraceae bacterium]
MKLPGAGMSWKEFFGAVKGEVSRNQITDVAGAVTYSGILALFPFVLFLLSLASLIISPQQAEQLVGSLAGVAPAEVTKLLGDRIRSIASSPSVGLLSVGAVTALWAASGGVTALMHALNTVYGVTEQRPFWKARGLALLMTLVSGLLALVAALVAIVTPPIAAAIGGPLGTALVWARLPVAGLIMMFLWAVLYYALPDVEQDFKFITPGSVVGVVLWVIASWGFSLYVSHFGSYEATYGSVGGIIVLLLWMWISTLVMLLGAQANAVIEHRSEEGKRAGAKRLADSGPSASPGEEAEAETGRAPSGRPLPGDAAARARARAAGRERAPLRGLPLAVGAFIAGALLARRRQPAGG